MDGENQRGGTWTAFRTPCAVSIGLIGNHTQSDGDRTLTEQPRRISNPARKQAVPAFVPALAKLGFNGETGRPRFVPRLAQLGFNGAATVSADSHLAFIRWASPKTVYIPCMSRRNHAAGIGDYCDAVLSGEIIAGRSLLAQFGLTPKSKRGKTASEAVDPMDAL